MISFNLTDFSFVKENHSLYDTLLHILHCVLLLLLRLAMTSYLHTFAV